MASSCSSPSTSLQIASTRTNRACNKAECGKIAVLETALDENIEKSRQGSSGSIFAFFLICRRLKRWKEEENAFYGEEYRAWRI
jgi:hypothetical protein